MKSTDLPGNSHKKNCIYETGREFFVSSCCENEKNEPLKCEFSPYPSQINFQENYRDKISSESDEVIKRFNLLQKCESFSSLNFPCIDDEKIKWSDKDKGSNKYLIEISFPPSLVKKEECDSDQNQETAVRTIAENKSSRKKKSLKRTQQKIANFRNNSKSREKGPFKCPICSKVFIRRFNFDTHLGLQHESYKCEICHKVLLKKRFLNHMNCHTKPHECNICSLSFGEQSDLKQHMLTHTGERPYPCFYCGKEFNDKSARRKHYRIHAGEKLYSCKMCQKAFSQPNHLREHEVTHTKEKKHECELCGKRFTTKSSLQRHAITHRYTCNVCNEACGSESKLVKHKELHNTERPYACIICEKRFRQKIDLCSHTMIHTAEKNKLCTVCNNAFKSSKSLRIHYCKFHPTIAAPYNCDVCHRDFFVKEDLTNHLLLHKQ